MESARSGGTDPHVSRYRLVRGTSFARSFHMQNDEAKAKPSAAQKHWGAVGKLFKFLKRGKKKTAREEPRPLETRSRTFQNLKASTGKSLWGRAFQRALVKDADADSKGAANRAAHADAKNAFLQKVLSFGGKEAPSRKSQQAGWGFVVNRLQKYRVRDGQTVAYKIPARHYDDDDDDSRSRRGTEVTETLKHVDKYVGDTEPGTRRRRRSSVASIDQEGIRTLVMQAAQGEELPIMQSSPRAKQEGPRSVFYDDIDTDQKHRLTSLLGEDATKVKTSGSSASGNDDDDAAVAADDDAILLPEDEDAASGSGIQWYYVNPHARKKIVWDAFLYIIVVLTAVLVPLELYGRGEISMDNTPYLVYTVISELMFLCDMILTCVTGVPGRWGDTVYDVRTSVKQYLKGFMIPDLLAIIPLRFFISGSQSNLFGLLKLFRLGRIWKLNSTLEKFPGANLWRLLALLSGFVLLAHILGAIWFLLARIHSAPDGSTLGRTVWIAGWVDNVDTAEFSEVYTLCIYFALTSLTTVGYGDITAQNNTERAFVCTLLILAALSSALVFGNVAVIIQEFDRSQSRYQSRVSAVTEFFKLHKLHPMLEHKTLKYIDALWSTTRGIDHNAVLGELPNYVRDEIMLSLHQPLVASVKVFRSFSRAFMKSLVRHLKPQAALPGDFIIMEGDKAAAMYFIYKGFVQVVKRVDEELITVELGPGMFFGESALLNRTAAQRRDASVFASTLCHLFVLESHDFEQVMADFPEYRDVLQDMEARRMEVAKLRHKMTRSQMLTKLPQASETFTSKTGKSAGNLVASKTEKDGSRGVRGEVDPLAAVRDRVLEAKRDTRLGRFSLVKNGKDEPTTPGWVTDGSHGYKVQVDDQASKAYGYSVAKLQPTSAEGIVDVAESLAEEGEGEGEEGGGEGEQGEAMENEAQDAYQSEGDGRADASPVPSTSGGSRNSSDQSNGSQGADDTNVVTRSGIVFDDKSSDQGTAPTTPVAGQRGSVDMRRSIASTYTSRSKMTSVPSERSFASLRQSPETKDMNKASPLPFPTAKEDMQSLKDGKETVRRRSLTFQTNEVLSKSDSHIPVPNPRPRARPRRGSMPARQVRFNPMPPVQEQGAGAGARGRRNSMYQKFSLNMLNSGSSKAPTGGSSSTTATEKRFRFRRGSVDTGLAEMRRQRATLDVSTAGLRHIAAAVIQKEFRYAMLRKGPGWRAMLQERATTMRKTPSKLQLLIQQVSETRGDHLGKLFLVALEELEIAVYRKRLRILIKEEQAKRRRAAGPKGLESRRSSRSTGDARSWVKKLAVSSGPAVKDSEVRKIRAQAGRIVKHIASAEAEVRKFHAQAKDMQGKLDERISRLEHEQKFIIASLGELMESITTVEQELRARQGQ